MREEAGMEKREGAEFRWIESGAGEPLLFLHGLLGGMYHWEVSLETLAEVGRPIALALPIFDPKLTETSVEELGRHVVRFLDALDLHRVVLGGNSLGGHVALHVALSEPERVAGLIVAGSCGLFERTVTGRAPHRPSAAYIRARMEEVFYDTSLVNSRRGGIGSSLGDRALHGAARAPPRPRRPAPQHRRAAGGDPRPGP
ncbi:MAG: alpha/beta fold hydrolase, partial [Candidatus Rokuibacteriota bacterium]